MMDRHALVTGGARGIGAAIARALRRQGHRVTILGRDRAALDEAVARGEADGAVIADIADAAAVSAAFAGAADARGPVSILVNNAGIAASAAFSETTPAMFSNLFAVNVLGCVHAIQAALPGMRALGYGRVVTVASTAALTGYAYVSAYAAAKHAALGLTRSLAREFARQGITFNAVAPGFTDTDLLEDSVRRIVSATGRSAEQARADLARFNPQGRLVRPDEVARAVLLLCDDDAGAINGVCLPVAGGEVG